MGLLELTANVLTRYKADIKEHKDALKELQGEEKKLKEEELKAAEARNKSHDDWIKGMAKVAATVGLVAGGAALAWAGFNAELERGRLVTAAGKTNIDSLSAAAGGLKSQMELLEFAAQAQHGAFAASQDQMEVAQKAIREFVREGFSSAEVTKKVTDAVVALKDDGLKDLGVRLRATTSDADKFHAIMDALAAKAKQVDGTTESDAESVQRLGVQFEDSVAKIKQSLGQLVISMTPLIEAVGKLTEKAAGLVQTAADGWADLFDLARFAGNPDEARKRIAKRHGVDIDEYAASGDQMANWIAMGRDPAELLAANASRLTKQIYSGPIAPPPPDPWAKGGPGTFVESTFIDKAERLNRALEQRTKAIEAAREKAKAFNELITKMVNEQAKKLTDDLVNRLENDASERFPGGVTGVGDEGFGAAAPAALASQGLLDQFYGDYFKTGSAHSAYGKQQEQAYNQFRKEKGQSFLETTFGPIEDFNAYGKAFDMLGGATSAALSAWIDGSESAGAAFKKFIAEALKGLASQMLIESLKHAAYALGSLAFGDFSGAARHGAAAAAFGAGAVAAAVAAKELGGGAPQGARAGAAPAAAPTGGYAPGALERQPTQAIIVVGDDFADDTPRMRQLKAQRLVGLALGTNAVVYG